MLARRRVAARARGPRPTALRLVHGLQHRLDDDGQANPDSADAVVVAGLTPELSGGYDLARTTRPKGRQGLQDPRCRSS